MPRDKIDKIIELQALLQQQQNEIPTSSHDSNIISPREQAAIDLAATINLLSTEQKVVFDYVAYNASTCGVMVVYGNAGTGKSFLLNCLKNAFLADGIQPVMLAPTGVAAHTINGRTIHSFFGIDLEAGDVNMIRLGDFIRVNQHIVFLIDECSMIDFALLETLSNALQRTLQNNYDFGHATVIFFGDMAQLPPVNHTSGFFFEHPAIKAGTTFLLKTPQRQNHDDVQFIDFLNNIRLGQFNAGVIRFINANHRTNATIPDNFLRLYMNNRDVKNYNHTAIIRLEGPLARFHAVDEGPPSSLAQTYLQRTLALKNNARCMLIHNLDVENGWTNGTTCVAIDTSIQGSVTVQREDGQTREIFPITRDLYRTTYSRTQIPLVPCYAANIHKVQSLTVSSGVAVCLGSRFRSPGQLYVACSRVRSSDQIRFFGLQDDPSFTVSFIEQLTTFLSDLTNAYQ